MKKILYTIMALAISAFALQSCEDVPEPYDIPGQETGGDQGGNITVEPAGDGTEANPYNVAAALQYTQALPADVNSDKEIYIKGKITNIVEVNTSGFGNATFDIADEGDDKKIFKVYRCFDLGNKKFTSEYLQVGDEVVVKGLVVNFKGNTPETVTNKACLYSVNGNTGVTAPDPAGENLLANGGFETWNGDAPDNWKTTSSAGNATLTQSSDAHGGSYAVAVGFDETLNKRLAYKETTLKAGTYRFSFYAKATTAKKAQTRAGYVPVNNGSVGDYVYDGSYVGITNADWTLVKYDFKLTEQTTVCLIVMNPKSSSYAIAQDILVDDASLVTSDGGIITDGGDTPGENPGGGTDADGKVDFSGTTVTLTNPAVTAGTETVVLTVTELKLDDRSQVSGPYFFSDGTTITLDKGQGTTVPTFYAATKGFRVYALNEIKFQSTKPIAQIVMECDEYNGTKYIGNSTATFSTSGNTATYCNHHSEAKGGVQLRPQKFTITYAK